MSARGAPSRRPVPAAPAPPPVASSAPAARPPLPRWLAWGAAVATGLLWVLACPDWDLVPLAWVAMVPLLVAAERASSGRGAFFLGWLAGLVTSLGGFTWFAGMLTRFGGFPEAASTAALLGLSAAQALTFGLFAWLVRRIRRGTGWPMALVAPVVMVAAELVTPNVYPYHLAIAAAWWPLVIQIADLTGPLGVTALLVLAAGAIHDGVFERRLRPPAVAAAILAVALGYGAWRMSSVDTRVAAAPRIDVGLVQANFSQGGRGGRPPLSPAAQLRGLLAASADVERRGADLVVWPESAYPWWLPRDLDSEIPERPIRGTWSRAAGKTTAFRAPLVFGAVTYRPPPDGAPFDDYPWNSALYLDPDGRIAGRFDKTNLVVGAEHIPGLESFPWLRKLLPRSAGHFARGAGATTFPFTAPDGASYRLGPLICFEDVFAGFGRQVGALHPHLLVNLTNDTWFGDTAEPWQHLALSVYRAVEQRTALVRAVNTGPSAYVDPSGRVVERTEVIDPTTEPHAAEGLVVSVPLLEAGHTVYAALGDVFGYACLVVVVIAAWVLPLVRRRAAATTA